MRCFHLESDSRSQTTTNASEEPSPTATCPEAKDSRQLGSPRPGRTCSAFTILEVVIGLILMATVLVASLLSFSAHRRQLAVADKRIAAVSYADDLLAQLTAGEKRLPTSMRGRIPAQSNWYWQTSLVGTTAPMEVPLKVIRLQIIERKADGSTQILTSVEVVEPI